MALGQTIRQIANRYAEESAKPLANNPVATMVRDDLADEVRGLLGEDGSDLSVKASPGNGNWAEVPWAAIFEPSVTTSATRGYYPVYLFDVPGAKVHLSLNQGTTVVREEFGSGTTSILAKRADLMRDRLSDYAETLPVSAISLPPGRLGQDYVAGHAMGKSYAVDAMPDEDDLAADLSAMISAYRALIFRGGLDFDAASNAANTPDAVSEERRYRAHKRIERNRKAAELARRHHGTSCQCCGLNYADRYGPVGDGFIEVHHLIPISHLEEGTKVSFSVASDFAVLCANCHRMIHRMPDPSDLAALRAVLVPDTGH